MNQWDVESLQREILDLRRQLEEQAVQEVLPAAARYTSNAGQSIPNNTVTIVDFEDLVFDTRSAVTTGASWKFTAPVGGYYAVAGLVTFVGSTGWSDTEAAELYVYKNGALYSSLAYKDNNGSASNIYLSLNGCTLVYLAKGDYLDMRVIQQSGASLALHTSINVSIWKV